MAASANRGQCDDMAKHKQVEVGKGPPGLGSAGTSVPRYGGDETLSEPLSLTLSVGERSMRNGEEILSRVRQAIARGPDHESSIRELGRLVMEYPDIVRRVPEFWEYLNWLVGERRDNAVARILGDYRRGRPRERHGYLAGLMDLIIDREGCSAAKAARIAEERFGRRLAKDARSIERDYGRYRDLYRLGREGYYVPESELTNEPWRKDNTNGKA